MNVNEVLHSAYGDVTVDKDDDSERLSCKCLADHSTAFKVNVTRQGPLLMRLKMHSILPFPVVQGFDKDSSGCPGDIESDGRVGCGDAFLAINGFSLEGKTTLKSVIEVIRVASASSAFHVEEGGHVRELMFLKKNYIHTVASTISIYESVEMKRIKSPRKVSDDQYQSLHGEKYQRLLYLISQPQINDEQLREVASQGIPDETDSSCSSLQGNPRCEDGESKPGLRPLVWRILLGYLSEEKHEWTPHLDSHRRMYKELHAEMNPATTTTTAAAAAAAVVTPTNILENHSGHNQIGSDGSIDQSESACDENNCDSVPYDDSMLLEEIEKDVVRTYPELKFFNDRNGFHQTVLQRILFLYAKLNSGVKYVQGMNEIVGTLYYVFASDVDEEWRVHAEADTFFCFSLLMSDMQDLFIRTMDETNSGIRGRIQQFVTVLHEHDPTLVAALQAQGLDATFFSLRWMTTLMSREFDLPDTIRLWDSLFAEKDRHRLMCYLCCAMVIEQREALLVGDFSDNLRLLQTYPPTPVSVLLETAYLLWEVDDERSKAVDPLKLIRQEIMVGREMLGAAIAVAAVRTEQVTEVAKNVWMPAMTSAVNRFVSNASANVKKMIVTDTQPFDVNSPTSSEKLRESVETMIGDL